MHSMLGSFAPAFGYLKNELGVVISKLVLAKISEPVVAEMKIKIHRADLINRNIQFELIQKSFIFPKGHSFVYMC